ncbi:5-methylcytosine-specific restriction endonuclease McrA [Aquibacillus albus]|uniref:5-methylcytosine-specific restriction endonuclease McrA n=1 Tax=Aquibacillus albus TaxID=1168171 RepID=A0ABS2N6D4_9BACI|nr:5-methylcytosine-specific restriction endonuclease McrA [Aquibacillus albus]
MNKSTEYREERKKAARLRPSILERDDYKCRRCGSDDIDFLEVHHVHGYISGETRRPII